MQDLVNRFAAAVQTAAAQQRALRIRGGGTRDFYGGPLQGELLDVSPYQGIVAYEPTELVITARCGTPLAQIEATLREQGQMLAFEPPCFDIGAAHAGKAVATLGGCIATGLSGPRRPHAGAVRDSVLGVHLLDGRGADLRFGGQVMKNVAGYDVARLMTGALGTLGIVLEASLKTLPLPPAESTLRLSLPADKVVATLNRWAGLPLPLSATAYVGDTVFVRVSGSMAALRVAREKIGGEHLDEAAASAFWTALKNHTHSFFRDDTPLWRVSLPSTAPRLPLSGQVLIEWGGGLRWIKTAEPAVAIRAAATAAGGHATLFRGGNKSVGVFHPLTPALMKLHQRLKQAFDPAGVFNRGRMYEEL